MPAANLKCHRHSRQRVLQKSEVVCVTRSRYDSPCTRGVGFGGERISFKRKAYFSRMEGATAEISHTSPQKDRNGHEIAAPEAECGRPGKKIEPSCARQELSSSTCSTAVYITQSINRDTNLC